MWPERPSPSNEKKTPRLREKQSHTVTNFTGRIYFFICHRAHTDLYRVLPGLVPSSPSSYISSFSSSSCPHRVITVYCLSQICIAAPKYYCCTEICIPAPTYTLPLRNMLSRRHAHVRKPSLRGSTSTTGPRTCR